MAISIQIQKKDLFLLSAILVFLAGSVYVIAYNSGGPPSVMGHSSEELEIDTNNDGVADKTLQQAVTDGDLGGGSITCTSFAGAAPVGDLCSDCYLEDRNQMIGGARYLLSNDAASITHRCIELGYDWGYATDTYTPTEWCSGYPSNARTKRWAGGIWQLGACENYNVKYAECCTFN